MTSSLSFPFLCTMPRSQSMKWNNIMPFSFTCCRFAPVNFLSKTVADLEEGQKLNLKPYCYSEISSTKFKKVFEKNFKEFQITDIRNPEFWKFNQKSKSQIFLMWIHLYVCPESFLPLFGWHCIFVSSNIFFCQQIS